MGKTQILIHIDAQGRLQLPREMRTHLGIEHKGTIIVEAAADGSIVLRDAQAHRRRVIEAARGSCRDKGDSVDQLIAERRAESSR